jgi:hypothetical protein
MTIVWTLLKAEIAAVEMPQFNSGSNCKGPSPGNSSLNRIFLEDPCQKTKKYQGAGSPSMERSILSLMRNQRPSHLLFIKLPVM